MFRKDQLSLGILLGLLTPVAAFFLYYLGIIAPRGISLPSFFYQIGHNLALLPKVASICLVANGIVFYLYTSKHRDVTAKGIFLVTLLYAIVILLLKIF